MFSSTSQFSEAGGAAYQRFLDDFYATFLGKVATGRDMDIDAVHEVAQGRVWTGTQALERGLVDELGGLPAAVAKAAELAELEAYGVTRLPEQKDFIELLMEDLAAVGAPTVVQVDLGVPAVSTDHIDQILILEHILRNGGVAALMPGGLEIR
jgi:protease-4